MCPKVPLGRGIRRIETMIPKPFKLPCIAEVKHPNAKELESMGVSVSSDRKIVWVYFYSIDAIEDNENWDPEDTLSPKSFLYGGYYYWPCFLNKSKVEEIIEEHFKNL